MEAPRTPAQWFALLIGAALAAWGVLALIFGSTNFSTVSGGAGEGFVIWEVSGWETILYMGFGALGLLAATRVDTARGFALLTGAVFAAIAVWGFIDGNDVVGIFAVDTTDNVTHAAIGVVGLLIGLIPEAAQRRAGIGDTEHGHGGHASHA